MTDLQENKLSMQLALREFLTDNDAITSVLPGYPSVFSSFRANVTEIQEIRELQEINIKGARERKEIYRKDLEAKALSVAIKTQVYAKMNDLPLLASAVNYTKSKMAKAQDTIMRDIAEVIYNHAEDNLAALADYGVTAAMLVDLRAAIDLYVEAIPDPRLATTEKKKATDRLKVLFRENDEYLKKLDLLTELLRSDEMFYGQYKNVRKLIETNKKVYSVIGKITDFKTGLGVKGAKISFTPKKVNELAGVAAERVSGDQGGFIVKSLAEGEYLTLIRKSGYMEKVMTVYIADGDTYRLNVAIETEEDYRRRLEIV